MSTLILKLKIHTAAAQNSEFEQFGRFYIDCFVLIAMDEFIKKDEAFVEQ